MRRAAARGFTLVELLVVIAIIGILIALLLPAVQAAREAARRSQCQNNLKQLGLAVHSYHDVQNAIPYTRIDTRETWAVLVLPQMEQSNLYEMWDFTKNYYNQLPEMLTTPVPGFYCPSRRTPPQLSVDPTDLPDGGSGTHLPGICADYAAVSGDNVSETGDYYPGQSTSMVGPAKGAFRYKSKTPLNFASILDGLSNTIFIGEKHVRPDQFGKGSDGCVYNGDKAHSYKKAGPGAPLAKAPNATTGQFGSYHPGVCQFLLGDGSVRAFQVSIDLVNLGRLANRQDGEVITADF
jgi:prepilin-type N-terminal cleavage/methylation domain-containing protein